MKVEQASKATLMELSFSVSVNRGLGMHLNTPRIQ